MSAPSPRAISLSSPPFLVPGSVRRRKRSSTPAKGGDFDSTPTIGAVTAGGVTLVEGECAGPIVPMDNAGVGVPAREAPASSSSISTSPPS